MDYICSAMELPTPVKVAARAHGGFDKYFRQALPAKCFRKSTWFSIVQSLAHYLSISRQLDVTSINGI